MTTVLDTLAPGDVALIQTAARLRDEFGDRVTVQVADSRTAGLHPRLAIRVVLDDTLAPRPNHSDDLLWIFSRHHAADGPRPEELYYFTHPAMGRFHHADEVFGLVQRLIGSVEPGKPLLCEEYAMFSDEGNSIIRKAIMDAFAVGKRTTAAEIGKVATAAGHNEATDTAVREAIWAELERLKLASNDW